MDGADDTQRTDAHTIEEAIAALPQIAAALEPSQQPADGSWVALAVHSGEEDAGAADADVIHRAWFTWRYDTPLEPLDESRYLELTRDEETDAIKVPVWLFGLTPLGPDEWRLDYWFAAPLRMWMGPRAGNRVQSMGATYVARRDADGWTLDSGDVLLG
ncbi:MAG: hypothetical protein GX624_08505 [Actinobacteria bacterium]|nr:hypothetical protein [Actinomycetota bacterium]